MHHSFLPRIGLSHINSLLDLFFYKYVIRSEIIKTFK